MDRSVVNRSLFFIKGGNSQNLSVSSTSIVVEEEVSVPVLQARTIRARGGDVEVSAEDQAAIMLVTIADCEW